MRQTERDLEILEAVGKLRFNGMHFRTDIADKALQ